MADDQPCPPTSRCAGQGIEPGIEFDQAALYELDPAVGFRGQRIENRAIEHEDAMHTIGKAQGMIQGGMVEAAQVTAKPDKGGWHVLSRTSLSTLWRILHTFPRLTRHGPSDRTAAAQDMTTPCRYSGQHPLAVSNNNIPKNRSSE